MSSTINELAAHTSALAAELAAKPALVIHMTKRQVEAAAPSVPPNDEGPERDVADLAAAFADPESREIAAAYMRPAPAQGVNTRPRRDRCTRGLREPRPQAADSR